ncbi:MAG: hypothetical protein ACREDY_03665 [Bradyrhizobium sp.]
MSVHPVKKVSYLDVPAKLRELADQVEAIKPVPIESVVIVLGYPHGQVAVRAYGKRTSGLEVAGWLARSLSAMTEHQCVDEYDVPVGEPPKPAA